MSRKQQREGADDYRPGCDLAEVLVPEDKWSGRPARQTTGFNLEALARLVAQPPRDPDIILGALVEEALSACGAGSAGVSLEDLGVSPPIFRWRAVAGRMAPFLGGTMPRDFSPCTETVARNRTLVMREPVRHYPYIRQLGIELREVMLVPFGIADKPVGTVWVIHHDDTRHFSAADARVMANLATFAAAAVSIRASARRLADTRARLVEHSAALRNAIPKARARGAGTH